MKEEVRVWWRQALSDLDTAKFNFSGRKFDAAAFFAQQAAEKALKALHISKFNEIKKTHDLVLLANKLNLPEKLVSYCKELSPAYMYTRYPDVIRIDEIKAISSTLINYSEGILKWVKERL